MTVFERTKELAKKRKLSLREVNDKAKLGTNSIYKWKSSKPSFEALSAVAKVLNTTTDYLNGLTNDPKPKNANSKNLTWQDLGMSYGGEVPDDFKTMVDSLAEGYFKAHPEAIDPKYRKDN